MNRSHGHPPTLAGCDVLPAMDAGRDHPPVEARRGRRQKPKGRTAGRFAVLNGFIDLSARDLTRSELLVWLVLYRDCRDGIARTGQTDIARRTGLSPRMVRYALRRLAGRGLLTVVHRGGLNRGPSIYRPRGIPPDGQGQ